MAKVRTDDAEQVRAELRERTGTWLQVDPLNPAIAIWTITGPTEQLVAARGDRGRAGSAAMSADELAGRTHGMAKVDLLDDALLRSAAPGPVVVRCGASSGWCCNSDTLFDDGPAADDPGEVRGTGHPVPVTATDGPGDGRRRPGPRRGHLRAAGRRHDGHLQRLLRVGPAPAGRLDPDHPGRGDPPGDRAGSRNPGTRPTPYEPTVEIADTVRARDPVCTFPGCGVPASRCDLDHVVPHPRGPTAVHNLSPRSRRCHRFKTAALWRCRTRTHRHRPGRSRTSGPHRSAPARSTQVAVLPGYARGEGTQRCDDEVGPPPRPAEPLVARAGEFHRARPARGVTDNIARQPYFVTPCGVTPCGRRVVRSRVLHDEHVREAL